MKIEILLILTLSIFSTAPSHVFATFVPHGEKSDLHNDVYLTPSGNNLASGFVGDFSLTYAQPGKGVLDVEFTTSNKKPVVVSVYDMVGRTWFLETVSNFQGVYERSLPVVFSPGVYVLHIRQQERVVRKKIWVS
jgi:hypothetical protein